MYLGLYLSTISKIEYALDNKEAMQLIRENARKTIICNRGEIILLVSKEGKFAESVRKELSELGLHDVYVAIETDKTT